MSKPLDDRIVENIEIREIRVEFNVIAEDEKGNELPGYDQFVFTNISLLDSEGKVLKIATESSKIHTEEKILFQEYLNEKGSFFTDLVNAWRMKYAGN